MKSFDISTVTSQYLCNSCGACFSCCNQKAISYRETPGGHVFPQIEEENCTHCGLCYEVCPGVNFKETLCAKIPQDPFVGNILSCEVGCAVDKEIFSNSQSGGVATALLTHLFKTGKIEAAIVAVMQETIPPRGDVLIATTPEELCSSQKSKYTPVPILKAIQDIGKYSGGVALVGLPCHMHGVFNLLDTFPAFRKHQIYKIGLICDRVMTTAAIDFMGRKATGQPIQNFIFRDKQKPTYPGNPVVYTESGQEIRLDASLRMAIKDFFTPARCRLCFDKLNIFSDVVLGDPHGLKNVDRINGETLVMVRNERGRQLMDSAKSSGDVDTRNISIGDAVKGQGIDKKREEWAGYMKAWSDSGRNQPAYPFHIEHSGSINRYKQLLANGPNLDGYKFTTEIMRAVDNWLLKKKIRKAAFLPLTKFKSIFRPKKNRNKL